MVPEEKLLEIEVERGMRDGQTYPFVAEGKVELKLGNIQKSSTISGALCTPHADSSL